MTLEEAVEYAAEHLPEGWEIQIHVENGAGWVNLQCPTWEEVEFEDKGYGPLADQVEEAVKTAIRAEESK